MAISQNQSLTALKTALLAVADTLSPVEGVTLSPNPVTFTPVTSSSTGRIAADTGSRTHVASMIVGSSASTLLQVLNDSADQYALFFSQGTITGATAFQLKRRLIGNDYDYNAALNVNWPRTLVSGDKIALIVAGDPKLVTVELNDTLVWGPYKATGAGVNDVWDQEFPSGTTFAGARSNAGARPVTVGRIETGTILSGTSLYTSGELVFTASYVGSPDGFRARVVNATDGTQIVGWANATLKSTTGAGNATASITPTIPSANAGTDVVLEVQHMKNGSPVANTVGRQTYYARPTFTPLAVGYNATRSVAGRNLLFRDIIKEGFYDGNQYNIPFADIRGSGYIAAPAGSTLAINNSDGTWTMTRNSDGTRYDCTFTGDGSQRSFVFGSGGIPSFLKYYPNNADPDSVNAGILPAFTAADLGGGIRDLEIGGGANYQAPQTIFLTADNRAKVSDFNYVNGTPTLTPGQPAQGHPNADGVPFEKLVTLANQLYAANSNNRHFGHIIPYHVTDDYVSAMYTYIRDNLNPNIFWYDEFANERPWNYNKERPIFEGTKAGLNDGTAYPNLRWFPGLTPNGVGQGPAAQTGDIIQVSLYGSDGHGGIQPGGISFWRAKANVAAGTDIYAGSSSSWDRLDTLNNGGYAAGQKQLGKRSVEVWTIGRDIFGATAWNARMRPTLCGQARSTSLDGLAPELNVTGFMDLVRCIGNSAYTYDNIDVGSSSVTPDAMYLGFVGDLEGDHQVRVAKWTDAVLRSGKQGYWYEWGLHPNVFSGGSASYNSAWYTLQAQTRIRELDRLLARNMKRHATGAAYYYQPFFGNEWGLRRNGYGDTTSPRWLGHKEGLAS
ncbi:hypothetical protein [Sphingomonas sp. 1P08PE]|uniref:hypothetical protein n=1 Tax=Sphingomonas sp. 1P08PE TaxID=554122 RepID=UPI0039A333CD